MAEDQLARPKPRIDHPDELDRMVRQIVRKVDPVAIYLFGSRARGDARPDSDYDLLIVVPDSFPAAEATVARAFRLTEGRRIPIDALLVREHRFLDRAGKVGTLSYKVAREGVALHER